MLAYLKRLDEVEAAAKVERLGEVDGAEPLRRDKQLRAVDVFAVDAKRVLDAGPHPHVYPSSDRAAHVQDAGRQKGRAKGADNPLGGISGGNRRVIHKL